MVYYSKCCCLEVSTGAKVIAILSLMASMLSLVITSTFYGLYDHGAFNENEDLVKGVFALFVIAMVFNIVLSWLMLYGVHKENDTYMLPYLIVTMIEIVVSITKLFNKST